MSGNSLTCTAAMTATAIAYAAGGKGRPRPGAFAPWNPKVMLLHCGKIDADGSGMPKPSFKMRWFSTREPCVLCVHQRQASVAGGLGACCAPSGEREGRSPLAVVARCQRAIPRKCAGHPPILQLLQPAALQRVAHDRHTTIQPDLFHRARLIGFNGLDA